MHNFSHPSEKKPFFSLARLVLAFGLFSGFFWPSEGLRPSSGQKIPKTALRPKQPGCSKTKFFVLPHDTYVGAFLLKIYQTSDKPFQISNNPSNGSEKEIQS